MGFCMCMPSIGRNGKKNSLDRGTIQNRERHKRRSLFLFGLGGFLFLAVLEGCHDGAFLEYADEIGHVIVAYPGGDLGYTQIGRAQQLFCLR